MIVAKLQIWIVGAAYVFIAIVEKRLRLSPSLNEIFHILSLIMFEKIPMDQLEQTVATEDYVPTYDHCSCWDTTGINNRSLLEGENQEL